jgi:hypothetical protein
MGNVYETNNVETTESYILKAPYSGIKIAFSLQWDSYGEEFQIIHKPLRLDFKSKLLKKYYAKHINVLIRVLTDIKYALSSYKYDEVDIPVQKRTASTFKDIIHTAIRYDNNNVKGVINRFMESIFYRKLSFMTKSHDIAFRVNSRIVNNEVVFDLYVTMPLKSYKRRIYGENKEKPENT